MPRVLQINEVTQVGRGDRLPSSAVTAVAIYLSIELRKQLLDLFLRDTNRNLHITTQQFAMSVQILARAPELADFTPLQEHQESTPGVFFGGKPVLHLRAPNATLVQPKHIGADATWPAFQSGATTNGQGATNGDASEADETVAIGGVDVFVTSEYALTTARRATLTY